jgi:hypothetical protein
MSLISKIQLLEVTGSLNNIYIRNEKQCGQVAEVLKDPKSLAGKHY